LAENNTNPTPEQEIREKLKQLRASYTRAQKLVVDVEKTHAKFIKLRDTLADKENGVKANIEWVKTQKSQISLAVEEANKNLKSVEDAIISISSKSRTVTKEYEEFKKISEKVFNKENGLEALHRNAQKLLNAISNQNDSILKILESSRKHFNNIGQKSNDVNEAYEAFLVIKEKVENPESGFEGQLRKATEYATSAATAKTQAESELVTVKKLKDESNGIVDEIKESKVEVDGYNKESRELTDDIRNTLNKASEYSLSKALKDRTGKLSIQLVIWGVFQFIAVLLLIGGVGLIFYGLFLHDTDNVSEVTERLKDGPTLISVITKILFTTPLVFAVYFTTTNFNHVRDLRDRYAWKETVAKNFQNYIKILKDEFGDEYRSQRFNFSMRTVDNIYKEPHSSPKKKKYNIGINRVFQIGIEEEDFKHLEKNIEEIISEGVEEIVSDKIETDNTSNNKETPTKPVKTKALPTPKSKA